ncbi:MAG: hypothetical protein MZV65_13075 [Chromatiales bacterium]|nr:hypothetical protein [Chromatiales bacterium]
MNYPRGLIRYTTENALEGKPAALLRPRVLIYGSLLAAIAAALVISVLLRVPLDVDVIRDRNTLYRETNEGLVENVYTLRVLNMDNRAAHLPAGGAPASNGLTHARRRRAPQRSRSGQVRELAVRLQADPGGASPSGSTRVTFPGVEAQDSNNKLVATEEARFLGPGNP